MVLAIISHGNGKLDLDRVFILGFSLASQKTDCQSSDRGFMSTYCCFETWAISFTTYCLCLSEEMLGAVASFCLESHMG